MEYRKNIIVKNVIVITHRTKELFARFMITPVLIMMLGLSPAICQETLLEKTAREIRTQASLPSIGSIYGRPLPLFANWSTGHHKAGKGWTPEFQFEILKEGRHFLPNFSQSQQDLDYYQLLKIYSILDMPVSFTDSQWERILTSDPFYYDLPFEINPNVVTTDGELLSKVTPMGLIEHWTSAGEKVTDTQSLDIIQELYPDPKKVILLSNNEHSKLSWRDANKSQRFVDFYGEGKTDVEKREIFGDRWISLYRGLFDGMINGLSNDAWKQRVEFVGYDAFRPPFMGRWWGWNNYALSINGRGSPWPDVWDGSSISYYTHDWNGTTDYKVWSPQIESMNFIPELKRVLNKNPNHWFEMGVWDGTWHNKREGKIEYYENQGQVYTPERYAGFVKYGMWMLRPRVVREFRGWAEFVENHIEYTMAASDVVEEVYENKTLQRFWRYGQLVANPNGEHPYKHNLTQEQKAEERWYLLDVNVNELPIEESQLNKEINVFALAIKYESRKARKKGGKARDEFMVLTFSPLANYESVIVTVPGYGDVTVDSTQEGSINIFKRDL